jgi:Ca2+/Na+ antiporter
MKGILFYILFVLYPLYIYSYENSLTSEDKGKDGGAEKR